MRRKKKYRSRLADGKLNTLVEHRINEISKKNDRKQYVWYKPKQTIADANFAWNSHGSIVRVPYASMLLVNAGYLWNIAINNFGGMIKNQLNLTSGHSDLLDNYVRCKALLNRFEIRHQNPTPCKVCVFMVSIPSAVAVAQAVGVTVPTKEMIPDAGFNGLYAFHKSTMREDLEYKFKVIARKTIVLPAARQYEPPLVASGTGTVGVPQTLPLANTGSNQGYTFTPATGLDFGISLAHTTSEWTEPGKVCYLNEFFKGEGKRFQLMYSDVRPKTEAIYLCAIGDSAFRMTCVMSSKFRLEGPQDGAQPGN